MIDEETQSMSIRLPVAVYEQVRRLAYETHQPMNTIVAEAVRDAMNAKSASTTPTNEGQRS